MARVKVRLADNIARVVFVDPDATNGATLDSNLFMADGEVATPASLRQYLGLGEGGTLQHSALRGLQQGDDHPQYTMWAAKERITGQWQFETPVWGADGSAALPEYTFTADQNTGIYRVGADNLGISTNGVARWDVNTERTFQSLPLRVAVPVPLAGTYYEAMSVYSSTTFGGLQVSFQDGTPTGDDIQVVLGLWSSGTPSTFPPFGSARGFQLTSIGHGINPAEFKLTSHHNSLEGTLICTTEGNRAQLMFVDGTASAPSLCVGGYGHGLWWDPVNGRLSFSVEGSNRFQIDSDIIRPLLVIRGEDGQASGPAYSFINDDGMGMFRLGNDQLGFAVDGVNRLTLTQNALTFGVLGQGVSGDASGPMYSFSGDPNTGMFRNGADDLGFSAGGTLRLNISTSQVVSTLPLRGPAGSASAPSHSFSSDNDSGLYSGGADIIYLATGGTARLGLGAAGELLDAAGSPGAAGQVPTSAGSGAAWAWGAGGGGGGGGGGLVYVNTSVPAGNTVANAATETAFESEYEIGAGQLQAGTVVRIRALGVFGTDSVAPTIRLRVMLDSTVVLDSGAVTLVGSLTNQGWLLSGNLVCFTNGASGTVDAQGIAEFATATGAQFINLENSATATVDTTTAQTLSVSVEWGTADADNTITLRELQVDMLEAVTPTAAASASATYLTEDDETSSLPNSRQLVAGTNVTFDDSTPGQRTINASGGGGGTTVGATLRRAANQSVAASTDVAISWDTEDKDDGTFWVAGSPTVVTIPSTGWYSVSGTVEYVSGTGSAFRYVTIRLNGSALLARSISNQSGFTGAGTSADCTTVHAYLTAGDTIDLVARQTSGGAINVTARLSIVRLP